MHRIHRRTKLSVTYVIGLATAAILMLASAPGQAQTTISLNPAGTYFRYESALDPATNAAPINLLALGLHDGDLIRLERLGDWDRGDGYNDDSLPMAGVFSSSSTLLAANLLNRVPGAINAGADFATSNTYNNNLSTDIPEDFFIGANTFVFIPTGARYLFTSPNDAYFGDNTDPDRDWGLRVTLLVAAVPEPGSMALLAGLALPAAFIVRRRVRKA